jgi:hypothetical protein
LRYADHLARLKRGTENHVNVRRVGQKHHGVFAVEGERRRDLCAFDGKQHLLAYGIHTMAHGHYAVRRGQPQEFDESAPESALSASFSPWASDGGKVGLVRLYTAITCRVGLTWLTNSCTTRGSSCDGWWCRPGKDGLLTIRGVAANEGDDDDDEPPRRAYRIMDDGEH